MKMKKLLAFFLTLMMLLSSFASTATVAFAADGQIKNIIYMIPDGGGMDPFYLADAVKQAGGFNRSVYPYATQQTVNKMYLKDYLVGAETTHSANYAVTDSAASGTALATGKKTNNYYIGIDPNRKPIATILEAAQTKNMRTGLVSTYPWAHATPASFSSHALDRYDYRTIAEQQVNQGLDVVLPFNATGGYAFDEAQQEIVARGYSQVTTVAQMKNLQPGQKVWGTLGGQMTYANRDITNPDSYPTLAEMTEAAIKALNVNDGRGFFLMVEGSAVDGGGHANNALDMVSEFIAFDEACKIAIEFAKGRTDTVVVAAPDHDTGGMNVRNQATAVSQIRNGTKPSTSYITWDSTGHTARNGGVFVYTPAGVSGIPGTSSTPGVASNWNNYVIDNTAITPWLAGLINVNLEEVTKSLFVDVSRMGTYTPITDTFYDYDDAKTVTSSEYTGSFKFTNYDLTVVRNQSIATYNGQKIDMNGEVAVYSGGRFYVPQSLLDQCGIEVDNTPIETVSSVLTGVDLTNNIVDNNACNIYSNYAMIPLANQAKAYLTVQIGVPKTAYYHLQAMLDTSNGQILCTNGIYGTFDTGSKVQFAPGKIQPSNSWTDDASPSVLLEEGNHTITFNSTDLASNIMFHGIQLVEDVAINPPAATEAPAATPVPTEAPDYVNFTEANAPYAGVYQVTSDKAVTITNETGHTATLAANTPAYFYLIKGSNNITKTDASATLKFTPLMDNGMDFISQVNAGTTPMTSAHIKFGVDGVGNVASQVDSTYGRVTVGSNDISIPNSSSATLKLPVDTAGLYYMSVITSGAGNYLTVSTDTGHFGQYKSTLAGTMTHYEDEDTDNDFLLVYLRKGDNYLTFSNSGPTTITLTGVRCSRASSFMAGGSSATDATIAQFVLANCKVVHDNYNPDGPVATPVPTTTPVVTPTPTEAPSLDDVSLDNAPYAGVYAVTADKATTITTEIGSTATLAAGETKYVYLLKGANVVTNSGNANLTITGYANNGLDYLDQVTANVPLAVSSISELSLSGNFVNAQGSINDNGSLVTFGTNASVDVKLTAPAAGLYVTQVQFVNAGADQMRIETDTGFYGIINQQSGRQGWNELFQGTHGVGQQDLEIVFLRAGENTITFKNPGTTTYVSKIKLAKTGSLASLADYNWQLNLENLKVLGAEAAEPEATPVPTVAPTQAPTPTPVVVAGQMTYQAPYAGVYKASSDKAVTLLNETGHKVTLSAGGTGYFYMFKGLNTMSTTNEDANVTFTALDDNGMNYLGSVSVDNTPITTKHYYMGFSVNDSTTNAVDFIYAKDSGVTTSGRTITIPAGQSVTFKTNSDMTAGTRYVSIKTLEASENLRIETSTGYYGVFNYTLANSNSHFEDTDVNGNGTDLLMIYMPDGENYVKLINNNSKTVSIDGIRLSKTDSVQTWATCNMANAKVIVDENLVIPTPVPTAAPTPTPVPTAKPDSMLYTADYAGVYAVTSDKAVTLTSELGSTATINAGETKYIYLIAGTNNVATSDKTANVTFTALDNNGLDYKAQVVMASEPIIRGQEDEIATGIYKTLAAGEEYTFTYTAAQAGIMYPYILFTAGTEATVTTDTGFYTTLGGFQGSYGGTTWAWMDAAKANLSLVYVREGENTITIKNTGNSDLTMANIRIHSAGELVGKSWDSQLNVAYLTPVVAVSEPTVTPTPEPTPDVPANEIVYTAPYAGVYKVSSDVAVTLTGEIGSTVTLAAGEEGYIYLIAGANTIATTNVDANVTFTALAGNGMDYFNQVTIANEPIITGQEDLYGWANIGITIPAGGTYTIEYTPSQGMNGMVYPYIAFGTANEATLRLTSDTGFYADIYNPAGVSYSSRLTTDAAGTDIELLYVREGLNTITLENIGSSDILLYSIRFHSVGELVNHATWGPQLNVANLKPVVEADKFSEITLNGKTKTATVSFKNMGTDDDGIVSLVLASYEGNKLTAIDITYIDTDAQKVGTTEEYSVDLPEATGTTLKAMLVNENLVPKADAKDVTIGSLTGLKFSILGDSISTFNGYSNNAAVNSTIGSNAVWYYGNNNEVTSVDQTWWKRVADTTGMEVLVNNSFSGDKVCVYGKTRATQLHNNDGETPDVIAVYLGTNDFANGCTLAQFATNYPAMIASITEKYPDADIYLLNLLYYGSSADGFCNVIEDAAETYGCTYVDIRNDAGFTSSNLGSYMPDQYGVHPGSAGMELIANCVVDAMSK